MRRLDEPFGVKVSQDSVHLDGGGGQWRDIRLRREQRVELVAQSAAVEAVSAIEQGDQRGAVGGAEMVRGAAVAGEDDELAIPLAPFTPRRRGDAPARARRAQPIVERSQPMTPGVPVGCDEFANQRMPAVGS